MMKYLKSPLAVVALSISLFACSEGNYTPTTTPYGVNNGTQAGIYNNPYNNQFPGANQFNPYLANPQYNQMSAQMQLQLRTQSMSMFSCAARSTPNFYMYNSLYNNCAVRRQPTYTPSSCACVQAPCNCAQVLVQAQTACGSTIYSSDHNGNPVVSSGSGSSTGGIYASDSSGNPTTSTGTDGLSEDSRTLPLSITGADARALYIRLAKTEEATNNRTKTKIRTGSNYKCMMDNRGRHDTDYACDIDVSVADGVVYQLYPVGAPGIAGLESPALYNGSNVQVGGPGLNPDEGYIKIQGNAAKFLYRKLSAAATPGTIDLEQRVQATIKLGKQVKCYQTSNTANATTECQIKVNSAIGEAENAS